MPESFAKSSLGNLPRDGIRLHAGVTRRCGCDVRSQPPAHLDDPLLDERPVGVLDSVRVQLQFFG